MAKSSGFLLRKVAAAPNKGTLIAGAAFFPIGPRPEKADFDAVRVMLFTEGSRMCGWIISPLPFDDEFAYVPRSALMPATLAVVRALSLADNLGIALYVVDPEGLWKKVWPEE